MARVEFDRIRRSKPDFDDIIEYAIAVHGIGIQPSAQSAGGYGPPKYLLHIQSVTFRH